MSRFSDIHRVILGIDMSSRSNSIFIAGNGPSLREINFQALRHVDWLGMNAAYRYWDEVGIYPNIYCCLDKVVVKHHAAEILRLIRDGAIDRFFLVKDILDEIPELETEAKVCFLEDIVQSDSPEAAIFKTNFSDKKTTGSWAVRFAIYCGYQEIFLGGIDCSYVEVLPEAEKTGDGIELRIKSSVSQNPNYFFNSYQKPGDLYQVPNPVRHFGNLHLQAFEALNIDIERYRLPNLIKNTAKSSQLNRYGIYDYVPPSHALGYSVLCAVAVPLTHLECEQFLEHMLVWDTPAFLPLRLDSPLLGQISFHLFFDCKFSQAIFDKLNLAWSNTRFLKVIFSDLRITFLDIPPALNYYIREKDSENISRKMGPNVHFLALAKECKEYPFTFLMEADSVPIKANWLSDLNQCCTWSSGFWIAGSHPSPLGSVDPALAFHINGNAIYATGCIAFQEFLDDVFIPTLQYLIFEQGSRDLAYDCLISKVMTYGSAARERRNRKNASDPKLMMAFGAVQENIDRFRFVREIKNISHIESELSHSDVVGFLDSEHVIVHSKRLTEIVSSAAKKYYNECEIDFLEPALIRRFKDTFIKVTQLKIFACHYYSNLEGYVFDRFDRSSCFNLIRSSSESAIGNHDDNKGAYVIFVLGEVCKGDSLVCKLELIASAQQNIFVRFSRHGEGRFAQDSKMIVLEKGVAVSSALSFECVDNYQSARLFIRQTEGELGVVRVAFDVKKKSHLQDVPIIRLVSPSSDSETIFKMFLARMNSISPLVTQEPIAPSPKDPPNDAGEIGSLRISGANLEYPKLLMIDSTPVGHGSATGQLKRTFLSGWPNSDFLQIWEAGGQNSSLRAIQLGQSIESSRATVLSVDSAINKCCEFGPDVIYFRPVDSGVLLDVAERVVSVLGKPLVVHMMDDWPERLRVTDYSTFQRVNGTLRRLLEKSSQRLSICQAMSDAYRTRYGGDWLPLANGVDLSNYPAKDWTQRSPVSPVAPFVIRYMGGLADDMNYASVCDIAETVAKLQKDIPVHFEIYTMDWYRAKAERDLGGLPGVSVGPLVEDHLYSSLLCDADALLIAYNFDPKSIAYIGLSLANKMPECLASGVPVLAYGPLNVATINYLKAADLAQVVESRDAVALRAAIRELISQPEKCRYFGSKGRNHAGDNFSNEIVSKKFRDYIAGSTRKFIKPELVKIWQSCFRVEPGRFFVQAAPDQWRYTHSDAPQRIWVATVNVCGQTKGTGFLGGLRLQADRAMTVNVSLGRHGKTEYEGTTKRLTLAPGAAQTIKLSKEFTREHNALKLQVEVLELKAGGSALLTIDDLYMIEWLESIRKRLGEANITLSEANRRFRDGDLGTAMGMYLLLGQQHPLKMYGDNALMAARKSGMETIRSTVDLLQRITG